VGSHLRHALALLLLAAALAWAAPVAAQVSLVRHDATAVYNKPGGTKIGLLQRLNPVVVSQRRGAWLRVASPIGKLGWVKTMSIEVLQDWKHFDWVCQQWTMTGNVERMRRCLENAYQIGIHFGDPLVDGQGRPTYEHDSSITWANWNVSNGLNLVDDVIDINSAEFKNLLLVQRAFALFPRDLPSSVGLRHLVIMHSFSNSAFAGGWFSSAGYIYSMDMSDWDLLGLQSRNVLLHELSSFVMLERHERVTQAFKAIMAKFATTLPGSQSASARYLDDWHDFDFDAETGCGDRPTTGSGYWCGYGRAEPENDFNTMAELLWSSLYVPGYSAWARIGQRQTERGFRPIREKARLLLEYTAEIVLQKTGRRVDFFDND